MGSIQNETTQRKSHQPKDGLGIAPTAEARVSKASTITDITFTTPTTGVVKSSDGRREYHFSLPDFCECPDCQIRGNICKHLIAARQRATEQQAKEPEMPTENGLIQTELLEK